MSVSALLGDNTLELGISAGEDTRGQLHVKAFFAANPAPAGWDAISVAYPISTQEIYSYRVGGVSGTVLKTLTVNYSDASKNTITNLFWT